MKGLVCMPQHWISLFMHILAGFDISYFSIMFRLNLYSYRITQHGVYRSGCNHDSSDVLFQFKSNSVIQNWSMLYVELYLQNEIELALRTHKFWVKIFLSSALYSIFYSRGFKRITYFWMANFHSSRHYL